MIDGRDTWNSWDAAARLPRKSPCPSRIYGKQTINHHWRCAALLRQRPQRCNVVQRQIWSKPIHPTQHVVHFEFCIYFACGLCILVAAVEYSARQAVNPFTLECILYYPDEVFELNVSRWPRIKTKSIHFGTWTEKAMLKRCVKFAFFPSNNSSRCSHVVFHDVWRAKSMDHFVQR